MGTAEESSANNCLFTGRGAAGNFAAEGSGGVGVEEALAALAAATEGAESAEVDDVALGKLVALELETKTADELLSAANGADSELELLVVAPADKLSCVGRRCRRLGDAGLPLEGLVLGELGPLNDAAAVAMLTAPATNGKAGANALMTVSIGDCERVGDTERALA